MKLEHSWPCQEAVCIVWLLFVHLLLYLSSVFPFESHKPMPVFHIFLFWRLLTSNLETWRDLKGTASYITKCKIVASVRCYSDRNRHVDKISSLLTQYFSLANLKEFYKRCHFRYVHFTERGTLFQGNAMTKFNQQASGSGKERIQGFWILVQCTIP